MFSVKPHYEEHALKQETVNSTGMSSKSKLPPIEIVQLCRSKAESFRLRSPMPVVSVNAPLLFVESCLLTKLALGHLANGAHSVRNATRKLSVAIGETELAIRSKAMVLERNGKMTNH